MADASDFLLRCSSNAPLVGDQSEVYPRFVLPQSLRRADHAHADTQRRSDDDQGQRDLAFERVLIIGNIRKKHDEAIANSGERRIGVYGPRRLGLDQDEFLRTGTYDEIDL